MSLLLSFERLALYNQWMNNSIYKSAERLSLAELNADRDAYFGSIIGTLNHIMVGDILWFKRFADHDARFEALAYFRSIDKPDTLSAIIHTDLKALEQERERIDNCIVQLTGELTDNVISSALSYRDSRGNQFCKNFGSLLQHVFNHQTHHRGQVSTLLYQAGVDVGVTDILALIPEE
jgi:uncharacterized damage-inducible protein DinB